MASGLFSFSSPPHATTNSWQNSTSGFYTPQYTSKPSFFRKFAPTSPSPLRTSRNANLMSSPLHSGNILDNNFDLAGKDENTTIVSEDASTPFSDQPHEQANLKSSNFATPLSITPTLVDTPTLPFAPFISEESGVQLPTADERATQFQFAARARSSSPSVLLQSHAKDNRDSRKRLFLDRLRNKRDDARSNRTTDQVLRMDFVRERRQWEAAMKSEGDNIEDMTDFDADLEEEADLSPTEEKEIEELAQFYYSQQRQLLQEEGQEAEMEEFSDDGYDEVFTEMLSQESPNSGDGNKAYATSNVSINRHTDQYQHNVVSADSEMDMS